MLRFQLLSLQSMHSFMSASPFKCSWLVHLLIYDLLSLYLTYIWIPAKKKILAHLVKSVWWYQWMCWNLYRKHFSLLCFAWTMHFVLLIFPIGNRSNFCLPWFLFFYLINFCLPLASINIWLYEWKRLQRTSNDSALLWLRC